MCVLTDIKIDKVDLSSKLSTEDCISSALLPPCNRNANNAKDVYNVNDIIPISKIETLYDHAAEVLNRSANEYVLREMLTYMYINYLYIINCFKYSLLQEN